MHETEEGTTLDQVVWESLREGSGQGCLATSCEHTLELVMSAAPMPACPAASQGQVITNTCLSGVQEGVFSN